MTTLRISKSGALVGGMGLSVIAADLAARHGVRVELVDSRGKVLVVADGESKQPRERQENAA